MIKAYSYKKKLVTEILSESFDTNLSVNYVVKQDNSRKARIKKLMDYSFEVCNAFGEVWISDDEQACALILLPDNKRTTLNALLWDAKLAISVIGLTRIGSVLGRETRIKSFHPKEPFYYLWFIGVKPEQQGKGKGSLLLNEIIKESERKGRPIYLETSVERNLPWYQNHGFEIFHTINLTYTLYLLRKVSGHSLP
jgi:ribosomal protein S18 acetylase RimI-like enzyme